MSIKELLNSSDPQDVCTALELLNVTDYFIRGPYVIIECENCVNLLRLYFNAIGIVNDEANNKPFNQAVIKYYKNEDNELSIYRFTENDN